MQDCLPEICPEKKTSFFKTKIVWIQKMSFTVLLHGHKQPINFFKERIFSTYPFTQSAAQISSQGKIITLNCWLSGEKSFSASVYNLCPWTKSTHSLKCSGPEHTHTSLLYTIHKKLILYENTQQLWQSYTISIFQVLQLSITSVGIGHSHRKL